MLVYCAYCGKQIDTDREKYYSPSIWSGDSNYYCDMYNCYSKYSDKLQKERIEAQLKSCSAKSSGAIYTPAQFTGHKEQKFPDGSRYVGDFVDGKMHGKGKWFDADGTSYVGDWVNDQRTGKGKMTFADGVCYEGDFVNGVFHGYGKLTFTDGSVYTGQFHENKFNGKGKLTLTDGSYYEGDFVDAKRTGKGKLTWTDGSYYEGDFVDGVFHGYGKRVFSYGDCYEGDWVNDKRTGKGKYTWANGAYYEGDFVDGDFNGYGIRLYSDGYKYEGQFKDDKRHGKGVLTSPDGTAVEYYYEDDEIVRNIAESSVPTLPKTTATAVVRKTETAVPVAKVVEESFEESSEQKIWDSLLKMSEKEKEAFLSSHPEITVPAGVEKIPQYMFNNCLNLKSIRFNQDLREIGPWAFMGCKNLGPVLVIPSSVEKVGRSAFSTCNSVKKIILPNNIHIEGWGFMCGVTEVEFETEPPKGVVLDRGAFCLCNMSMSKETKKKIKELNPKAFKS